MISLGISHRANSDLLMVGPNTPADCKRLRLEPVGAVLPDAIDAENERHIASCAYLMELAYASYEASGCFADKGEADRWMRLRDEAVKGRSAVQVAWMEAARGLNGR